MALSLYAPFFWVVLGLIFLAIILLQRRLALRWWPAWILRLAILVLVLIGIFYPTGKQAITAPQPVQVLIVDRSSSIREDALRQMLAEAQRWQIEESGRTVILSDLEARVMLDADTGWQDQSLPASYLDKALQTAQNLIKNSSAPSQASIILASDGLATDPAAMQAEIQWLRESGIRLDVIPLPSRSDPLDVYTGPLSMPSIIWENTPLRVLLPVYNVSGENASALTFETLINDVSVSLSPIATGPGYYVFQLAPQESGMVTIAIQVKLEGDPDLSNNSAYATARVLESPQALLVSPEPDSHFLDLLKDNGILVEVVNPEDFYTMMPVLGQFGVIFLDDFLAERLSDEEMTLLRFNVLEQGKGLVFLGGKNSYTLGGYENTILEPILPVKLEAPQRSSRDPLVFTLLMDSSSSMGTGKTGNTPLDLGKEAAMRAIELLRSDDQLGILVFSTEPIWGFPIAPLGDGLALRTALDTISSIRTSGGTYMYKALEQAVREMSNIPQTVSQHRNILLLTDGNSADGNPLLFEQLAKQALEQNIIISTIGLGVDADGELLRNISEWGGGRYYIAKTADQLPRIMMNESRAARSENIQAGETVLVSGEVDHPLLSGILQSSFPTLSAYNALSSKREEGAEDVLVSANQGDPILSVWQVGLGRVVAWMSDLGQDWSGAWGSPADEGAFWSQVVRYALPNPALGPAQAAIRTNETQLVVSLLLQDEDGYPLNFADPILQYTDSDLRLYSASIPQVDAGKYELSMARPALGAYRAIITYKTQGENRKELVIPFSVNSPFESHAISTVEASYGLENLAHWAAETGGSLTALALNPLESDTINSEQKNNFLLLLLIGLVVTWPIEIAIRRRWLPWRSLGQHLSSKRRNL